MKEVTGIGRAYSCIEVKRNTEEHITECYTKHECWYRTTDAECPIP